MRADGGDAGSTRGRQSRAGVPRGPNRLLDRPRLYASLDTAAPITVIAAPTGSGKSALLTGWANTCADDLVWLDATRDGAVWLDRLVEMLASLDPDAGTDVRAALRQLRRPLVLVVDDADELDPGLMAMVLDELDAAPLLRLVVAGRDLRILRTEHVLMRYDQVVVPAADLDFTVAETFELLHGHGITDHDEVIHLIRTLSGGHAAVLRATIVALDGMPHAEPAPVTERITALAAATVLRAEDALDDDPALRRFLADTAVIDRLEPALATALTEIDDVRPLLDRVVQLGLGAWLDAQTFTYSGAARMVLRAAARNDDPARVERLSATATRWLRECGQLSRAFRLAMENGDHAAAETQLRDGLLALLLQDRDDTQALLETVPRAILLRHPRLAFHLALLYNTKRQRRTQVIELLRITLAGLRQRPAERSLLDRAHDAAMASTCLRGLGRAELGGEPARAAVALLSQLSLAERAQYRRTLPVAVAHCGLGLLYAGDHQEGLDVLDTAAGHAAAGTTGRLLGLSLAAGARAILGQIREAAVAVATIRAATWSRSIFTNGATLLYLAEALIAVEAGDLDTAVTAVRQAREIDRYTAEHWELLTYVEGMVDVIGGQPLLAVERIDIERALPHNPAGGPLLSGLLTATRATAQLASGAPTEALAMLDDATTATVAGAIARGRVLLAMDRPDETLAALGRAEQHRHLSIRQRAEHAALHLAAGLRLSTEHAAKEARRLVAITSVHGLVTPLTLLPASDLAAVLDVVGPASAGPTERSTRPLHSLRSVLNPTTLVRLTPREAAVFDLLVETASTAQIATTLYVSVSTVKSQLNSIYRKLGVNSREQALASRSRVNRSHPAP